MFKFLICFIVILGLIAFIALTPSIYQAAKTIHDLLRQNEILKQCINNLTQEEQIGYAKVLNQETDEHGVLRTTLLFVETDPNDQSKQILNKQYTIVGDIIHFDALIIKFQNDLVMDGKEKSLYLWRRVYGENQAPSEGFPIEAAGYEPPKYKEVFKLLNADDKKLFWSSIWDLAENPDMLNKHGIKAIFGNAIYKKLKPKMIYIFRIDAKGQVYPDSVPEI